MFDDRDEPSGFRVVDRRSFSTDGTRREDAPADEKEFQPAAKVTGPGSRAQAPKPTAEREPDFDTEPTGFDTLVSYLSTTAMFQLGLIPGPSGERIPVDMPNARRTIDLLAILQEKTQGNLTPEESRLLEEVLYELRVSFVELEKRLAKKPR